METTFNNKAEILSDLWLNYRKEEAFKDFVEYNDLGLPLAYSHSFNLAKLTAEGEMMIDETFDLLLAALDVKDEGYDNITDLLGGEEL